MNKKQLEKIILTVGKKINLFSGNCGIFSIALAKFLDIVGKYNLQYIIYVNKGYNTIEDYFNGETDIYHVILHVEGEGIDDFFDGHGDCNDEDVLSILKEYGKDFGAVSIIKLSTNYSNVERFIRNNTNYNSSTINEHIITSLLVKEFMKIK